MTSRSAGDACGSASDSAAKPCGTQPIEGNVHAVELAVVLGAVLKMVDHLQRIAQRVVERPQRRRFAMQVEDEPADRRRRIAAVVHQLSPIRIASLGDVAAEGFQEIERVAVGQAPRLQSYAQPFAFGAGACLAAQARLQAFELGQLPLWRGGLVVGDIVGRAREAVEGEDGRPQLGAHQPRGHREILVPMPLAGGEVGRACHESPAMAWTRPFHRPPRPRQKSIADCTVKKA